MSSTVVLIKNATNVFSRTGNCVVDNTFVTKADCFTLFWSIITWCVCVVIFSHSSFQKYLIIDNLFQKPCRCFEGSWWFVEEKNKNYQRNREFYLHSCMFVLYRNNVELDFASYWSILSYKKNKKYIFVSQIK